MSSATLPAKNGDIGKFLTAQSQRIADVLPPSLGLTPERVIKLAALTVHRKPELQKCSHVSILSSVLEASSLGLEIGGALAEAHLVPFGGECVFIPDYKGLLKLARRSGEFDQIETVEVFERDLFRVFRNPLPTIQHELFLDGPAGPTRYVYAYAVLKSGGTVFEIMNRGQVEEVRNRSRSKDSPAWKGCWGEMAKKVVLKRLLKRQSRSIDVARASAADDQEYVVHADARMRRPTRGVAGVRSSLGLTHDELSQDAPGPITEVEPAEPPQTVPAGRGDAYEDDLP